MDSKRFPNLTKVLADAAKDSDIQNLVRSWFHTHLDESTVPETLMGDIVADVYETADPTHYTDDDVAMSCRRTILEKLGIGSGEIPEGTGAKPPEDAVTMVLIKSTPGGWWRLTPLVNNEPAPLESFSPETQKLAKKAFESSDRAHQVAQQLFPHAQVTVY
jgi:hypothetical protein